MGGEYTGREYQGAGILEAILRLTTILGQGLREEETLRLLKRCFHLNLCEWCWLTFCSVQHILLYIVAQAVIPDQVGKSGGFVISILPFPINNSFIYPFVQQTFVEHLGNM